MEVVANRYRASPRISESQREDLLLAVVRAQFAAIQHLSRSYSRGQIAAEMQALANQISVWAEPRDVTAQRGRHFLIELDSWAHMFRNDLHNIRLLEQIEERTAQRRAEQIEALRLDVGAQRRCR